MSKKQTPLSQSDWLKQGFQTLTKLGPPALRAELLAREIGATKGSFYWHFKDIGAFKLQILSIWTEKSQGAFSINKGQSPTENLLSLANFQVETDPILAASPAIRAWAQDDTDARNALDSVDQFRLKQLGDILSELGISNPDFPRAIYATMIGLDSLTKGSSKENLSALSSLLAAIIALAEA